jgi:hypothetical protein
MLQHTISSVARTIHGVSLTDLQEGTTLTTFINRSLGYIFLDHSRIRGKRLRFGLYCATEKTLILITVT